MNLLKTSGRYFIILFLLLITSCGGASDFYEELSGGYFYRDESNDTKEILGHDKSKQNIFPKVISYAYNKNFIIAAQEPLKEEYIISLAYEFRTTNSTYAKNSKEDIEKSEIIADSIIQNNEYYKSIFSRKINFWIISHNTKKVFGPLSLDEYIIKRKELGVPEELKLKLEL